jgi:hypothetical protein
VTLGSRVEVRPEDAVARHCAAVANSRSRTMSKLTQGGRQPIGMGKRDS